MSLLKTQIYSAVLLPMILFPWHTSDNVPLTRHGVDSVTYSRSLLGITTDFKVQIRV